MTNWRRTINIKDIIDPDKPAQEVAKAIAAKLRRAIPKWEDDDQLSEALWGFDDAQTTEDVDSALTDLYNWADFELIWLGP